jgi:hypothetical protein
LAGLACSPAMHLHYSHAVLAAGQGEASQRLAAAAASTWRMQAPVAGA